jgi:hypothetical protein
MRLGFEVFTALQFADLAVNLLLGALADATGVDQVTSASSRRPVSS